MFLEKIGYKFNDDDVYRNKLLTWAEKQPNYFINISWNKVPVYPVTRVKRYSINVTADKVINMNDEIIFSDYFEYSGNSRGLNLKHFGL